MGAVILALFDRFGDAEDVRTELVKDGFPTDRVELTASREKGRAAVQPAESPHDKFVQYFGTLFKQDVERRFVQELAKRVASGRITTIAVHPRGDIETSRATQILEKHDALQLLAHDLQKQEFEHAASPQTDSWLARLLPDHAGEARRFYLRLLGDDSPEQKKR